MDINANTVIKFYYGENMYLDLDREKFENGENCWYYIADNAERRE